MTDEQKKAYTARVSQANPTELVVILYEIALDYIKDARQAHADGDKADFRNCIHKTQSAVLELLYSVQDGQPISDTLRGLYGFSMEQLSKADAGGKTEPLDAVERILGQLKEAYAAICGEDTRGAVMSNAQTVYAGLTYGRGMLCEDLADQSNRGFRV